MTDLRLDPEALPAFDIVTLANSGALLRAESETPADGIPAFVTAAGWSQLQGRYGDGPEQLARGLGAATQRLLTHAAQAYAHRPSAQGPSAQGARAPAAFSCPSDLFEESGMIHVAFVRDTSYPVICAVIGTATHLRDLMQSPFRDDDPAA